MNTCMHHIVAHTIFLGLQAVPGLPFLHKAEPSTCSGQALCWALGHKNMILPWNFPVNIGG